MLSRLRTRSLALLLVGLMAWPPAARTYLACPDGTPCSEAATLAAAAGCCTPRPCEDHPAAPGDGGCVLRAEAEPLFIAPEAAAKPAHLPLLAVLPAGLIAARPQASFVAAPVRERRPPAALAPKQSRSARPPPHAHA